MKAASLIASALAGSVLALSGATGRVHAQVAGGADSVKVRAQAEPATVRPGERLVIVVVLQHAAGFHTWPNEPVVPPALEGLIPIATSIDASLPDGATLEGIRWPAAVSVSVRYIGDPIELLAYAGEAVVRLDVQVGEDMANREHSAELSVRYQACDERICYPPKTVRLDVPFGVASRTHERLRGR